MKNIKKVNQIPAKNKTEKAKSVLDPVVTLNDCLLKMKEYDKYWKNQANGIYESKLKLTDPFFIQINHLRQAFRFYIIPALENILESPLESQLRFIQYQSFIFNDEGLEQFFGHFYSVFKNENNDWSFQKSNPYERDLLLLYDLYKVKRTINGIQNLLKDLVKRDTVFPSVFNVTQQTEILKGMNSALFMVFKQSLKPKYQVSIFKGISLELLYPLEIKKRKKRGIIFGNPDQLDSTPSRRILMHVLFRNNIKTIISKKRVNIQYNLMEFEQLINDYFNHYLKDDRSDLAALTIYHSLHIQGKTLTASIIDDPDPEGIIYEEIDEIKALF